MRMLLSLLLGTCLAAQGQTVFYQTLQTSEFEVLVTADGRLFHNGNNDSLCVSPQGGTFFREAGFWISAVSDQGIHKAAHHHQLEHDYGFGPLDTLFGFTAPNQASWNRVWKLTREDINNHKEQFELGEYVAPFDLKTWPVHIDGDFPRFNAPFVDFDQNGKYESDSGDYPFVPGDEMIYCIYNDATGEGNSVDGFSLNAEVRAKYWIDHNQPNALFFDLVFFNRNAEMDFDSTYIGFFMDALMGRTKTYGETDLYQSAVYAFHAESELDEFNLGIPAGGFFFSNQELWSSVILDGQSGHRLLPHNAQEFRHVLSRKWTNGEKMTLGDSGIGGGVPVAFAFGAETHDVGSPWRDSDQFEAGRRYLVGSVDIGKWEKGDYKRLKGAMVMTSSGGLFSAKAVVNEIKRTASVDSPRETSTLRTWPNPSTGGVYLQSVQDKNSYVKVYTPTGRLIYNRPLRENHEIPCNVFLNSGIYIITVERPNNMQIIKQAIQR